MSKKNKGKSYFSEICEKIEQREKELKKEKQAELEQQKISTVREMVLKEANGDRDKLLQLKAEAVSNDWWQLVGQHIALATFVIAALLGMGQLLMNFKSFIDKEQFIIIGVVLAGCCIYLFFLRWSLAKCENERIWHNYLNLVVEEELEKLKADKPETTETKVIVHRCVGRGGRTRRECRRHR